MNTVITVKKDKFCINGELVYQEIPEVNPAALGLLWNQRVIQGVFDDKKNPSRFNLFKMKTFDPEKNTDNLIASLPEWYEYGLRAITVGFQGGWPVSMANVEDIENNPFGTDGKELDPRYASRMDRIIRAADKIGIVVIVSLLYWSQSNQFPDGKSVINAVRTGSRFLKNGGYTNVILEIANEYNINGFAPHPIVHEPEGMAQLIRIAREESGGLLVGASGGGGMADKEVIEESDVVIVHGNGLTRGQYYDFLKKVRSMAGEKPILCNEDSPCISRIDVSLLSGVSWGYYNNYTKQIPPADYGVTAGEDIFFARRMARAIGIKLEALPLEDQYYLQGLEDWTAFHGNRIIRLSSEFPETIDYVDFFVNGKQLYRSYDEPFFLNKKTTWEAIPVKMKPSEKKWTAQIFLTNGKMLEKKVTIE